MVEIVLGLEVVRSRVSDRVNTTMFEVALIGHVRVRTDRVILVSLVNMLGLIREVVNQLGLLTRNCEST